MPMSPLDAMQANMQVQMPAEAGVLQPQGGWTLQLVNAPPGIWTHLAHHFPFCFQRSYFWAYLEPLSCEANEGE